MRVLPILFNTDMVRAILDERKTVTRRLPSKRIENKWDDYCDYVSAVATTGCTSFTEKQFYEQYPPYQPGDILYVRETWQECCRNTIHSQIVHNKYCFKASVDNPIYGCIDRECGQICNWKPSIHMPKEAARIWLKVTDVQVERLRDIDDEQAIKEGFEGERCHCGGTAYACTDCYNSGWIEPPFVGFMYTWNSTIKKSDLDRYGWDANPWVWVIEFERCEKPEK